MDIIKLKARGRTGIGKSYTRKVRSQGWIPAVYYGHNRTTKVIEINDRDFAAIVRAKQTNHLIDLSLPGEENDSIAVIKEVQRNVIKDNVFFHIDFLHVNMNEKVTVHVPVHLKGIPAGVKDDGGILNQHLRHLTVSCLPADMPEFIDVDVTALTIGHSIHVRDISVEKVEIKDPKDDVIAVVGHPQSADISTAAPAADAAAVAAPEATPAKGAAPAKAAAPAKPAKK